MRDDPMPRSELIEIARELLDMLTVATRSGQSHLMRRVLDILQPDVNRPTVRLTEPQLSAVLAAVTELQQEAVRAAPDIVRFCLRATHVIDILSIS